MKRILTLLILLLTFAEVSAQKDLSDRRPVWFGVNMGGTWQTSDMKPQAGIGWGFTVARYSRMSKPGPLYFGWRFRFLDGRNYGYNYHGLTGIKANPVLSAGTTNYSSGTDPDTGMVFSNYKMRFDEFAFEIVVGSNSLRKKGFLLYGFGGAGLNYWKTSTDQLDANGLQYDYSTVSLLGDDAIVQPQLESMWDGEYETNANGSVDGGQWGFMPSAGIGFGYQWNNFAIVAEHRTTWALNDLIDGTNHNGAGASTGNNDIYHYDGLTLRWNFSTNSKSNSNNPPPPPAPNPNQYSNQPPPPPQPTPPPTTNPVDPTPNPQPIPVQQPPTVQFTTPNVDPYTATALNQSLVVRVTNVTSSNQIQLIINNQVSTNFSFNPNTQTMTFTHTLLPGNNVYKVTATNNVGSAQDVQTITYKGQIEPTPSAMPPQVTITNPPSDPYTSTTQTYTVNATVLNVPTAAGIQVTRNGSPVSNFNYNPTTQQLSFVATLQTGNNLYQVVGTNTVGSASDAVTIVFGNANTSLQPPVVTITNPASCPYSTKTQAHTLTATITNVSQASQVSVVFNNQAVTNFTFTPNGANANISFPVQLNSGANNLSITGTNTAGSNTKSCVLTYKPQTPDPVPPQVTITNPTADPFTAHNAAFTLTATVINVNSSAEITMTSNNAVILGWTYDMNTKVLTYNTTLSAGTVTYKITAANSVGTDSETQTVIFKVQPPPPPPAPTLPPTVDITQPNANPFITSTAQQTVIATVMNVTQQSQITVVKHPNTPVPFTFDALTHKVTFSVILNPGANQYIVTATNSAGTANDYTTLKLVEQSGGAGAEQPGGGTVGRPGQNTQTPPPPPPPPPPSGSAPTITVVTPSVNPANTTNQQFAVTMTVTGVTGMSQIGVRVNNMAVMNGSYNAATQTLTFTASLTAGMNAIAVTATNSNGTATKNLSVVYNAGSKTTNQTPPKKNQPKKEEPKKEEPKKEEPKKEEPAPAPTTAPSRGTTAPTGSQTRPR